MQVLKTINTYNNSADLTAEPAVTTYDVNILTGLYEKERLGWAAHVAKTGEFMWTLVPGMMKDCVECMRVSINKTGERARLLYERDAPEGFAARCTFKPRTRASIGLPGMGSRSQ